MSIAAVVPVRSLAGGKARLAGVLEDGMRARLNTALLSHTLALTAALPECTATFVVSADAEVRARATAAGATVVEDPRQGLNPAVAAGLAAARGHGAVRTLVLPIDLPRARPEDVAALAACTAPVVIAPDRREAGTNALCLATGLAFRPRFGADSFCAHLVEGRRLGAPVTIRRNPFLGLDIDTEADWQDWGRWDDRAAWIERRAGNAP